MPNGHGGVVRFLTPVIGLIFLAALASLRFNQGREWTLYPAVVIGAITAWRFSWHLHLYPLMEYGGAYASEEQLTAARRLHAVTGVVLVTVAVAGVAWIWT